MFFIALDSLGQLHRVADSRIYFYIAKVRKISMQNKGFSNLFQIYLGLRLENCWQPDSYDLQTARNNAFCRWWQISPVFPLALHAGSGNTAISLEEYCNLWASSIHVQIELTCLRLPRSFTRCRANVPTCRWLFCILKNFVSMIFIYYIIYYNI